MSRLLIESARGIQIVDIEDKLFSSRKIFIEDEITDSLSNSVIRQLMYLENDDNSMPITIYINSPGGSVQAGLAIYDVIRLLKSPVTMVCSGLAASMGAIIYLAGDKRFMLEHSRIMIHDPAFGGTHDIAYRKPLEIQYELDDLNKCREKLASIIAERTGKSLEEVYEVTKRDSFYNADEAVDFGLATDVVNDFKDIF